MGKKRSIGASTHQPKVRLYYFTVYVILDVDECETVSGICVNGDCVNLEGSFTCRCRNGFRLSSSRDACIGENLH